MSRRLRPLPWLLAGALSLALVATVVGLRRELEGLRREHRLAVQERSALQARLGGVDRVVDRLIERRMEPLLAEAESERSELERALAERDALIAELERTRERWQAAALEERVAAIDAALGERFASVESRIGEAMAGVVEGRSELAELREALPQLADPDELWAEVVAPVAQVNGELSVGSAVVLESRPGPDGARTPILTAWHVVRDVQQDPTDPVTPVPIRIFRADGAPRDETATVLAWDVGRDVALLELDSREAVAHGARLAGFERLLDLRTFDPIHAVGCPLGTEPVPTFGSIAAADHRVDGRRYLMTNAPTYIGNSGGGIFDAETGELLGVFSKIYNHGNLRPTIVPHMGLSAPLDEVYRWLEREGFELVRADGGGLAIAIERERGERQVAEVR